MGSLSPCMSSSMCFLTHWRVKDTKTGVFSLLHYIDYIVRADVSTYVQLNEFQKVLNFVRMNGVQELLSFRHLPATQSGTEEERKLRFVYCLFTNHHYLTETKNEPELFKMIHEAFQVSSNNYKAFSDFTLISTQVPRRF